MYCPVDGTEYREGITRCPEHDVELVDEPPEPEEEHRLFLESMNDRAAVRLAFLVLLSAAAVYAISGVAFGVVLWSPSLRESSETLFRTLQAVNGAGWAVGIAALGALAGAVLLRTYSLLRDRSSVDLANDDYAPGLADGAMRLLYVLVILCSLVWAVTGVATSWETAELNIGITFGGRDEPGQTFVSLVALNSAAYACGVAAFAVMAAGLGKRTHDRMSRRV